MKERPGCLKSCAFGCLGVTGLVLLFLLITAGLAAINLRDTQPVDESLQPRAQREGVLDPTRPGRMILKVSQGELTVKPVPAGEQLSVHVKYDGEVHALWEDFEVLPDSSWVYRLEFERTMPAMQAMFRAIMGGGSEASVEVRIPPDLPLGLELELHQGGAEVELGGLWITDAAIDYSQGGLALEIDEPLVEPMTSFAVQGSMGGVSIEGLGNASPRTVLVHSRMGGADVGLGGAWRNDCDVDLNIRMGGMGVGVPDDVMLEGVTAPAGRELRRDTETPLPVLRFRLDQSMGEIELY